MTDLSLSADELRSRHIDFVTKRITGDRAREDFVRSLGGVYDHFLAQRVRDVLDPHALASGIVAVLTHENVAHFGAPIGRDVHARVIAALQTDNTKIGTYVPEAARAAIDAIVSHPYPDPKNVSDGSVFEGLIRHIFEQEAIEEVLHDILYNALREFNASVNPFFADWGLPGLLKRLLPLGSGAVLKSLGAVRAEFDKRLDPEMRKFLLSFSRNTKIQIASYVIANFSDPKFLALRKSIALFFYEQTLAEITKSLTHDVRAEIDRAALAIALEVVAHEEPRKRLALALAAFVDAHGDKTIGAWLATLGVTERPDLTPLAELLWPHLRMALASPPARAFIENISHEFVASLAGELASKSDAGVA
ncbi:MAG: hypothetical protein FWD73_16540 [Polyangiaceae bacterium]|nr:hypothetical protein [Polyangiaceae bacterium]